MSNMDERYYAYAHPTDDPKDNRIFFSHDEATRNLLVGISRLWGISTVAIPEDKAYAVSDCYGLAIEPISRMLDED